MKITRIVIENYKSIKHIDINFSSKVNAFIGENSVGKIIIKVILHYGLISKFILMTGIICSSQINGIIIIMKNQG